MYIDAQLFEKANEIAEARGWKPIRSLKRHEGMAEQPLRWSLMV